MIADPATDLQGAALLLAVIEREGGDIHAAFAVLCAQVRPGDLAGDTFERALARAVHRLLVGHGQRLAARSLSAVDGGVIDG